MRRCGNRVIAGMACVAMQLNSGIGSVSAADELFHVDATLLAQSWSQNDLPEISAISQPIKHDFDIKAAAAWEVSIGTDLFNPLLTWGRLRSRSRHPLLARPIAPVGRPRPSGRRCRF